MPCEVSEKPLLLRQIPIWEQGIATGFVDLALERAFVYRSHAPSEVVDIDDLRREKEARFQMLERLADYDEHLMEELLGDIEPERDEVMSDLRRELAEGHAPSALELLGFIEVRPELDFKSVEPGLKSSSAAKVAAAKLCSRLIG